MEFIDYIEYVKYRVLPYDKIKDLFYKSINEKQVKLNCDESDTNLIREAFRNVIRWYLIDNNKNHGSTYDIRNKYHQFIDDSLLEKAQEQWKKINNVLPKILNKFGSEYIEENKQYQPITNIKRARYLSNEIWTSFKIFAIKEFIKCDTLVREQKKEVELQR